MGESMHVCGYVRCGRAFAAPVRLTDFSNKPRLETYFACPYCFSKVNEAEGEGADVNEFNDELKLLHSEGFEVPDRMSPKSLKHGEHKKSSGSEAAVNCPHSLGYLKTRSKDEAFPDSCLTCPQIFKCMT